MKLKFEGKTTLNNLKFGNTIYIAKPFLSLGWSRGWLKFLSGSPWEALCPFPPWRAGSETKSLQSEGKCIIDSGH